MLSLNLVVRSPGEDFQTWRLRSWRYIVVGHLSVHSLTGEPEERAEEPGAGWGVNVFRGVGNKLKDGNEIFFSFT